MHSRGVYRYGVAPDTFRVLLTDSETSNTHIVRNVLDNQGAKTRVSQ